VKRALTAALLVLLALPLLYAVAQLPPHGSASSPPYTHVSPRYLERGPVEAGAENVVTDVILNYRGFDTNGEVTVIFTALAAVLAVLLGVRKDAGPVAGEPRAMSPVSPVVSFVVRLLAPFVALFAIYVILNGHVSPGGGFQGGAIIGALVIVTTVIVGRSQAEALVPARARRLLQAAAPLTFVCIGIAGLLMFGDYLAFPRVADLAWLRTAWLIAIEMGIGVGGAAIIATIFWTMGDE